METIITWFGEHPGFLGYFSGFLIFLITLVALSKQWIGFLVTLLLLFFSLIAGFSVAHHQELAKWLFSAKAQTEEPKSNSQVTQEAPLS